MSLNFEFNLHQFTSFASVGEFYLRQFTSFASVDKSIYVNLRNLHTHKLHKLRKLNDLLKLEALCDVV